MKEKGFMKQVAESEMPDIDTVRKSCIAQLKEGKNRQKKKCKVAVFGGAIVATAMLLCLCIPPLNSFARQQIKVLLKLNDSTVQIGEMQANVMTIPEDCDVEGSEGEAYRTKLYNDISALVKDIGIDIYTWQGTDRFEKDGILLSIVDNDYGSVSLHYDVGKETVLEQAGKDELESVYMLIYMPLSKNTTLGDLMLENKQFKYSRIDDEGNIEEYKENTEYELIEQYQSPRLNSTVTVIASKVTTDLDENSGDSADDVFMYYVYFTLDGMCYKVGCDGTLDAVHRVVEEIGKTDLKTLTKK